MKKNPVLDYFKKFYLSATTIFEGLIVTFANMMRKPYTIQYPDKLEKPVKEMLPPRYRGFLEVDINICTACLLCMKACPINCIFIEVGKDKEGKMGMTGFAIDISKCMFCGLCTEPCPTGSIRHTSRFECATENIQNLIFKFVKEGDFIVPFKAKKDEKIITPKPGEIIDKIIESKMKEKSFINISKNSEKIISV